MMTMLRARRVLTTAGTAYRVGKRLFSPVEVTTTVPASREEVYGVLTDPYTYPEWLGGAQQIRAVDAGFPAPGTAFHHKVGPSDEVTVADKTISVGARAPERLSLEAHAGPFRARVDFLLRPVGSGTEIRLRERPLGVWVLASPALRAAIYLRNRGSLDRLRLFIGAVERTQDDADQPAGKVGQLVGPGGIEPPTEEL